MQDNIKNEFTKYDSLAIKGIAILMMLMHHNFWKRELFANYTVDFRPFTEAFIVDLSLSFKICVSLFAFITGYGLLISLKAQEKQGVELNNKTQSKWLVQRLVSVLSGFWFVAVVSYIVCELLNGYTNKVFFEQGIFQGISKLLINFMGLSNLFDIAPFNSTWWYMSAAVAFVFLVPLFYRFANKYSYISLLFIGMALPRALKIGYLNGTSLLSFILPVMLGMVFAEYNLLVKLKDVALYRGNKGVNKIVKFVLLTLLLVILFKLYLELPNDKFWDIKWGIIPVFVIYYCYEFIIGLPGLRSVLIYLGKHSMNIFLVHTFINYYYLQDLTYGFRHFILITLFLLISSLILSYCIEGLKKLVRYDQWIRRLVRYINNKIDDLNKDKQTISELS